MNTTQRILALIEERPNSRILMTILAQHMQENNATLPAGDWMDAVKILSANTDLIDFHKLPY